MAAIKSIGESEYYNGRFGIPPRYKLSLRRDSGINSRTFDEQLLRHIDLESAADASRPRDTS